jgi:phage repressor protein C with HTH and peptisase S24 domain
MIAAMEEPPPQALARIAAAQGVSLSALSRMLGRNIAYLQQYVRRGSPRVLPEADRAKLAAFLGVEESVLGGPPREEGEVAVPFLAVAASAGPGALAADERAVRTMSFARAVLRELGVAPEHASVILVAGESMAPTLADGDRLLVDCADRRVPARGGVFVIREGDALSVKRLVPAAGRMRIVSDNPDYAERSGEAGLTVIGRARLLVREV